MSEALKAQRDAAVMSEQNGRAINNRLLSENKRLRQFVLLAEKDVLEAKADVEKAVKRLSELTARWNTLKDLVK